VQHGEADALKVRIAPRVVSFAVAERVQLAVDFHRQAGAGAEEIHDERADRMLTAEAKAVQALLAQRHPKARFGGRQPFAQLSRPLD
jgi:hypothetical protein